MSVIAEVRKEREDLARVLQKHTGIRKIVEDLYPDSAHFIYELLQNAEDTGATEATFALEEGHLSFEHDGRPFDKEDILAITDIGEGTKAGDEEKIGRFGVGFKAVFAYCENPSIWSPTFSFKISELVLPHEISSRKNSEQKTRFEFPFDNPKKPVEDAYDEVKDGLLALSEFTLLFLNNLETVSWKIGDSQSGALLRILHTDTHVEILKQINGKTADTSHFLKFVAPVETLNTQNVSIAYPLEFGPDIKSFKSDKPLHQQMKIIPAQPGLVAVFFPAEKETSGLRFHLHAPFLPELSRASIKETPANVPLFEQLAELAAASLHTIKDLNLLNREFLGVLPNQHDTLPPRYQPIRKAIIIAMNNEALTPIHGGHGHAPASALLQARASFKNLLTTEDLSFFRSNNGRWAVSATRNNSDVDRFLEQLSIWKWDIDDWIDELDEALRANDIDLYHFDKRGFFNWLSNKSLEWLQQLYSVLYREIVSDEGHYRVADLPIVRLSDGSYEVGKRCFFGGDGGENSGTLPRVDESVYTSGKSKTQQQNSRRFLEEVGVREVGDREVIEAILEERYLYDDTPIDDKIHKADIRRFVSLIEENPNAAHLFENYYIFLTEEGRKKPRSIYLDQPYVETGLESYYRALGDSSNRVPLSGFYEDSGISKKGFRHFVNAISSVQKELPIKKQFVSPNHPHRSYLLEDYYKRTRRTHTEIHEDWVIPKLSNILKSPTYEVSKLIWSRLQTAPLRVFQAEYRPNQQYKLRCAPSTLCLTLRNTEWVPQNNGRFVRPAEADHNLLPEGFAYDSGWNWLEKIEFESELQKQSEERRQRREQAKELGFEDERTLERLQEIAALLDSDGQERLLTELRERQALELPEQEPSNPQRRSERVRELAANSPERQTEVRSRSVAINTQEVREEAGRYLTQQYTNLDGDMICQVCKSPLPFKLDDGRYYFEKVEFMEELKGKRHYQNYLALCPNHEAMFKHANGSRELIMGMLLDLDGNELEIVLAQRDTTIYFTKTHLSDLRTLIETEGAETSAQEGSDSGKDGEKE